MAQKRNVCPVTMFTYSLTLALVALALAPICLAQDYDEWFDTVSTLNDTSVTFNCSEYPTHPKPSAGGEDTTTFTAITWMLPNLTIVDLAFIDSKYEVSMNGWQFSIKNVDVNDFGIYHCMMRRDSGKGDWYLVKWGINIRGPYFEDLLEKYELNIIIGFSAAGGFVAIAAMVWAVWHFRWQEPEGELAPYQAGGSYEMSKQGTVNGDSQGYVNAAYTEAPPTPPPDYGIVDVRRRNIPEATNLYESLDDTSPAGVTRDVTIHSGANMTFVAEADTWM